MKTEPVRDAQQTKQCGYSIPYDCGKCYIGETSTSLEVRIKEHKYNMSQGLLEKSKLAHHAYEEGHRICWNEARVLQIEPNITYRKYTESAHRFLLEHPIINPVWISLPSGLPSSQQKSRDYNTVKCSWSGNSLFSLCWYHKEYCFSPVTIYVVIFPGCKASYV
jgi:hypothetical protein